MKKAKPFIIGIAGGSGSGKTYITSQIKKSLHQNTCFISLDDFYKNKECHPIDKMGITNFDLPDCIDDIQFLEIIKHLKAGKSANKIEYTFNNEKAEQKLIHFPPSQVIVVEGLFIYHFEKIRELFDFKIFVEASLDIMLKRRIVRDVNERNYPESDVLYRYKNHVLPSYNQYILPYKHFCNLIVRNEDNCDQVISMIASFINQKNTIY